MGGRLPAGTDQSASHRTVMVTVPIYHHDYDHDHDHCGGLGDMVEIRRDATGDSLTNFANCI